MIERHPGVGLFSKTIIALLFYSILVISFSGSVPKAVLQDSFEPAPGAGVSQARIYVANDGWHTGLLIDKADLIQQIPQLKEVFPLSSLPLSASRSFLEVGWGDKDFYRASQITIGITLKAMFWADGSIVHVIDVGGDPKAYFAARRLEAIDLDPAAYQRVLRYVASSMKIDADQQLIDLGQGIYGVSHFFEGKGTYSLLNTCNTWTATASQSAGLDVSPRFK